jgi:hypothetical protein
VGCAASTTVIPNTTPAAELPLPLPAAGCALQAT